MKNVKSHFALTRYITVPLLLIICLAALFSCHQKSENTVAVHDADTKPNTPEVWEAPDISNLGNADSAQLIKYGEQLIESTAVYLGPHGTVAHMTNGMNCQNCHLNGGTKSFGNNYSAVAANYPKFRERSGSIESIFKRINDCVERSLNGQALDTSSREMRAIKAYIEWMGKDVPKGTKPAGSGLTELAYLDQATEPEKGKLVYAAKCASCHGNNGEGKWNPDKISYQYPPLWGAHSYTQAAGLFRISRFAGYVKSNMPFGANYNTPQVSDEDAWDVAAFVNSQPRPTRDISKDWPNIAGKPVDHPFGPYADTFSEHQHKYGPFAPIAAFKKQHSK